MIRLALLDDHPAVLVGLQRVIEQEPGMAIVGAAPTAAELARQLGDRRPDVLVVDAAAARLDGEDLPVFAMLLGGETLPAIADALRAETDEIAWRAQRIVGRLRPGAAIRARERELTAR
jgi:DNA-binding NarL/FixJ family response regulator